MISLGYDKNVLRKSIAEIWESDGGALDGFSQLIIIGLLLFNKN